MKVVHLVASMAIARVEKKAASKVISSAGLWEVCLVVLTVASKVMLSVASMVQRMVASLVEHLVD